MTTMGGDGMDPFTARLVLACCLLLAVYIGVELYLL